MTDTTADTEFQRLLAVQLRRFVDRLIPGAAGDTAQAFTPAAQTETVLTMLDRCRKVGEIDAYLRLLECFGYSLHRKTDLELLDPHLEYALHYPDLPNHLRVEIADLRARLLMQRGALDVAQAVLENAWQAANTPLLRAELHNRLGVLEWLSGRYDSAQSHLETALALASEQQEPLMMARVYTNFGNWAYAQDQYEDALGYYNSALGSAVEANSLELRALAEGGIGMTLGELGNYDQAHHFHALAHQHHEQAGDQVGVLRTYLNRSYLELQRGRHGEATVLAGKALQLAQELGDLAYEAHALHNMGVAHMEDQRYPLALDFLQQALGLRRWLGQPLFLETTREKLQHLAELVEADPEVDTQLRERLLRQCRDALEEPGANPNSSSTWRGR